MKNKKNSDIKISKEERATMISSIKEFFLMERDEELGEIGASIILDFFVENLGTVIYNRGIRDSYEYMTDKLEDMLGLEKY